MERACTGGSLFRNLYRDFLGESYELLGDKKIKTAYERFIEIADLWKEVSELFFQAGEYEDISYINQASDILMDISKQEKSAMEEL
jgi:hypothetical protein